jgi:hypothetical protein
MCACMRICELADSRLELAGQLSISQLLRVEVDLYVAAIGTFHVYICVRV